MRAMRGVVVRLCAESSSPLGSAQVIYSAQHHICVYASCVRVVCVYKARCWGLFHALRCFVPYCGVRRRSVWYTLVCESVCA